MSSEVDYRDGSEAVASSSHQVFGVHFTLLKERKKVLLFSPLSQQKSQCKVKSDRRKVTRKYLFLNVENHSARAVRAPQLWRCVAGVALVADEWNVQRFFCLLHVSVRMSVLHLFLIRTRTHYALLLSPLMSTKRRRLVLLKSLHAALFAALRQAMCLWLFWRRPLPVRGLFLFRKLPEINSLDYTRIHPELPSKCPLNSPQTPDCVASPTKYQ